MNSQFKPNSRFSSLTTDRSSSNETNNSRGATDSSARFKDRPGEFRQHDNRNLTEPRENSFNRLTYAERITKEKALYEQKKKQIEEQKAADLLKSLTDANSFPELGQSVRKNADNKCTLNYADKVKNVKTEEVVECAETEWASVEYIKANKKAYGVAKKPQATPNDIMQALVDRYEDWKTEYIELYGYDDYEHNYRFPNYDYEYFDKLDEKDEYERAMYEEQERERDNKRYDYMDYEQNTEYLND